MVQSTFQSLSQILLFLLSGIYLKRTISNPQGGHTSISLIGMLVREQISTTQKRRMTPNSNPQKIECPKIQTQKK